MDGELDVVQADLLAAAVLHVNLCLFDHITRVSCGKEDAGARVSHDWGRWEAA